MYMYFSCLKVKKVAKNVKMHLWLNIDQQFPTINSLCSSYDASAACLRPTRLRSRNGSKNCLEGSISVSLSFCFPFPTAHFFPLSLSTPDPLYLPSPRIQLKGSGTAVHSPSEVGGARAPNLFWCILGENWGIRHKHSTVLWDKISQPTQWDFSLNIFVK